jgi:hypothetical protein
MDKYILKNTDGEFINLTKQKNIDLAIQYFCIIKNLKREDLLRIYKVEKL